MTAWIAFLEMRLIKKMRCFIAARARTRQTSVTHVNGVPPYCSCWRCPRPRTQNKCYVRIVTKRKSAGLITKPGVRSSRGGRERETNTTSCPWRLSANENKLPKSLKRLVWKEFQIDWGQAHHFINKNKARGEKKLGRHL